MSIYYFFRCDDCDEWSDVIGRNTTDDEGKYTFRLYDVVPWLTVHERHHIRFGCEYWESRERTKQRKQKATND